MKLDELRRDVLRRLLMGLWGMLTLILLFSVILLINHMIQQGDSPIQALRAAGAVEPAPAPAPGARIATLGMRELTLFFAAPDGATLQPGRGIIEFTGSTIENCRNALKALIAGPGEGLIPVLPPSASVRALYLLEGGELVIDFSRDLLTEHTQLKSAALEALFVYGVVQTVTQPALVAEGGTPVQRVRFLVEGAPPPEAFPAHFDLSMPIAPDRRWVSGTGQPGNA